MNKRGQFYLVIALVISLGIVGVTHKVNTIEEPVLWEDFDMVSQNYLRESSFVINYALENKDDVYVNLDNFTRAYLEYAKKRNPNLGLLYIYGNGSNITITNYLDSSGVINGETVLGANQELVQDIVVRIGGKEFIYNVPVTSEKFGEGWTGFNLNNNPFNLSIAGVIHPFNLTDGPEFKVIIRTSSGEREVEFGQSGEGWEPLLSGNVQQLVS